MFFLKLLLLSDIIPLIKKSAHTQIEMDDLKKLETIKQSVQQKSAFPLYEQAIHAVRKSTFWNIAKYEKKALLKIFFIHNLDVHISIFTAILSVQVLFAFESSATSLNSENYWRHFRLIDVLFNAPNSQQRYFFAISLGALIFFLNLVAARMHAHKLEQEIVIQSRIHSNLVKYLFQHILNMDKNSKNSYTIGDLVNLGQNDGKIIADYFGQCCVDLPVLFMSTCTILIILFAFIGKAAWIGIGLVFLQIPISLVFSGLITRLQKKQLKLSDMRISLITEWIQSMRLIRYFGWGKHFEKEIEKRNTAEFYQDIKVSTSFSTAFGLSWSWWMIVSLGVFAAIIKFTGSKESSTIFATIWLITILGHQLTPVPWFVISLAKARVSAKRLQDAFNQPSQIEEYEKIYNNTDVTKQAEWIKILNSENKKNISVSIQLKNIDIAFKGQNTPLLKNLNLSVEPGDFIVILGPVGSGKSTLLQLLTGDILPSRGQTLITLHNKTLDKEKELTTILHTSLGIKLIRHFLAYVSQESFVTSTSVAENVSLFQSNESDVYQEKDILNALLQAQMKHDLQLFENGMNTELGERGVNLSGGQKQRLSLARGFYAKSDLLLLDDPLSAVDPATENALIKILLEQNKKHHQTIVMTTHRHDVVKFANKIWTVEKNEINVTLKSKIEC